MSKPLPILPSEILRNIIEAVASQHGLEGILPLTLVSRNFYAWTRTIIYTTIVLKTYGHVCQFVESVDPSNFKYIKNLYFDCSAHFDRGLLRQCTNLEQLVVKKSGINTWDLRENDKHLQTTLWKTTQITPSHVTLLDLPQVFGRDGSALPLVKKCTHLILGNGNPHEDTLTKLPSLRYFGLFVNNYQIANFSELRVWFEQKMPLASHIKMVVIFVQVYNGSGGNSGVVIKKDAPHAYEKIDKRIAMVKVGKWGPEEWDASFHGKRSLWDLGRARLKQLQFVKR